MCCIMCAGAVGMHTECSDLLVSGLLFFLVVADAVLLLLLPSSSWLAEFIDDLANAFLIDLRSG
jgi:hypothetical protein